MRFALLMQLQHLYYHFVHECVGLRHFMDYFVLLTHSTGADREFVRVRVRRFALGHACAAVMWVLGEVFGLSRDSMICPPDRRRGMRLYREMFAFDPLNTVLREVHYWHDTISLIPERIRRRKVFL